MLVERVYSEPQPQLIERPSSDGTGRGGSGSGGVGGGGGASGRAHIDRTDGARDGKAAVGGMILSQSAPILGDRTPNDAIALHAGAETPGPRGPRESPAV